MGQAGAKVSRSLFAMYERLPESPASEEDVIQQVYRFEGSLSLFLSPEPHLSHS